ncbi:hypothetical protein P4O66_010087 [Electrophorus voltai]|uniref:Uncharacterized protein n=1 Tax=Electrophorus voltai TaxID=2609070 RepID=A0AAD8ZBU0_9TELE|nr:hypothetical protein P4O66_010087 [Electrophorus voltai]
MLLGQPPDERLLFHLWEDLVSEWCVCAVATGATQHEGAAVLGAVHGHFDMGKILMWMKFYWLGYSIDVEPYVHYLALALPGTCVPDGSVWELSTERLRCGSHREAVHVSVRRFGERREQEQARRRCPGRILITRKDDEWHGPACAHTGTGENTHAMNPLETWTDEGSLGREKKEGEERKQTPFHNPRRETLHHPGLTPYSHNRGEDHWWIFGGGGPGYGPGSDSAESSRPQPDYGERYTEDQYSEVDSAGSDDPYMDYCEGYADYGGNRECSDVSPRSDLPFDCVEDPSMEVEEGIYGHPLTDSDIEPAVIRIDAPLAPKIPPKAPPRSCRPGAGKPSRAAHIEATSFEEETPSTKGHSPGTHAPVPKPSRGKKETTPVPTPEMGKVAGAPPETGQQKLAPAPQIGEGRSPTGGLDCSPADD